MKRNLVWLIVAALFVAALGFYLYRNKERTVKDPVAQPINCVSNLKMVGIAFRIWAGDHGGQFPFNVSTNAGGTLELCAPDKDGFDSNAFLHLKAMANSEGMTSPLLLVCPQDRSKEAATDWASLRAENLTYRFHSGTNVNESTPKTVLAVCPIDGNILFADGTVKPENKAEK